MLAVIEDRTLQDGTLRVLDWTAVPNINEETGEED